jgi:gluconolactonase
VLTPDETMLIVNGTLQRELIAYDVAPDGSVSNRRVFAEVSDPDRRSYPGYPEHWFGCDGMAMDVEGNVYVTCGAGLQVFDVHGRIVSTITIPEKPTNVCFAGPDRRTLFVTAQTSLYRLESRIAGVVFQQ